MRIAYFGLTIKKDFYDIGVMADTILFIINRAAIHTFFLSFTFILLQWIRAFSRSNISNFKRKKSTKTIKIITYLLIVFNIIHFSYLILVSILAIKAEQAGDPFSHGKNPFYDIDTLSISALAALIGFTFSIYGIRFMYQITKLTNMGDDSDLNNRLLLKILFISMIYSGCFILRCFSFAYKYITSNTLDDYLYHILCYFLPEGLSSLCASILVILRQLKFKNERNMLSGTKESGLMISQISNTKKNTSL